MASDEGEIIRRIQTCLGEAQKLLIDIATRSDPADAELKRDVRELINQMRGEKRVVDGSPETTTIPMKRSRTRASTAHTEGDDNDIGHSQILPRPPIRASNVHTGDNDSEGRRSRNITRPPIRALKSLGGDFYDSFVNAPLQCFAALIDPQALLKLLDTDFVGPHSSEKMNVKPELKSCKSEVDRQLRGYGQKSIDDRPSPVAEFIDTIEWMKKGRTQTLYAYRLQKMFSVVAHDYDGDQPGDAAEWVQDMLHCLSIGKSYDRNTAEPRYEGGNSKVFRSHFWIQEKFVETCPNCTTRSGEGPAGWILELLITGKDPVRLEDLLERRRDEAICSCLDQNRIMAWGLTSPPKYLVIRLNDPHYSKNGQDSTKRNKDASEVAEDEGGDHFVERFNVIIDEEVEINNINIGAKSYPKDTYVLQGIVKFIGDSPHEGPYIAYIRGGKPDLFYRYEGNNVREVTSEEATGDKTSGNEHSYLLFFKKREQDE